MTGPLLPHFQQTAKTVLAPPPGPIRADESALVTTALSGETPPPAGTGWLGERLTAGPKGPQCLALEPGTCALLYGPGQTAWVMPVGP